MIRPSHDGSVVPLDAEHGVPWHHVERVQDQDRPSPGVRFREHAEPLRGWDDELDAIVGLDVTTSATMASSLALGKPRRRTSTDGTTPPPQLAHACLAGPSGVGAWQIDR